MDLVEFGVVGRGVERVTGLVHAIEVATSRSLTN